MTATIDCHIVVVMDEYIISLKFSIVGRLMQLVIIYPVF
jgi:hypothetical protein